MVGGGEVNSYLSAHGGAPISKRQAANSQAQAQRTNRSSESPPARIQCACGTVPIQLPRTAELSGGLLRRTKPSCDPVRCPPEAPNDEPRATKASTVPGGSLLEDLDAPLRLECARRFPPVAALENAESSPVFFPGKSAAFAGALPAASSSHDVTRASSRCPLYWRFAMMSEKPVFRWVLGLMFFCSGFPALLYQIVWQRALFAIYGVNIESVTMVVSAFMLGLGLGSLAGGRISRLPGAPLLAIFGIAELFIAIFGLVSLRLFHWVETFTAGRSPLETGIVAFGLVAVPTILMGATLPILATHWVRTSGNVGRSVGILYFVNTLGSSAACFLGAGFALPALGMSGSIRLAAALNILVAAAVLAVYFIGWRTSPAAGAEEAPRPAGTGMAAFPVAIVLAALSGFISLSYEIVWYRTYAFVSGARPRAFAFVLGAFLAGIAFGSLLSRGLCREQSAGNTPVFVRRIAMLSLFGNLFGFVTVPLLALAVRHVDYSYTLPLIALAAGLMAATFPLVCHISIPPDARAGAALGRLYLSNIAGSTLGSFLVGYVLMEAWTLSQIQVFLVLIGVISSVTLLLVYGAGRRERVAALAVGIVLCANAVSSSRLLFDGVYERLQRKADYSPGERFTDIVETRSGVVTVDKELAIYGDGAYDGYLETDVRKASTVIRPLSLSLLHAAPGEILIIGASGGSWTQVTANHPQVKTVTVVEINPGYLTIMKRYPAVRPLLSNPKVEIFIDDGRRWLVRNPGRRYDMILMDTTYHWRAHATNLLSREFLELARGHLKPGGILYFNTTHSAEAQITGASVFPYAFRFGPFLAVSDSQILPDKERWRRRCSRTGSTGNRFWMFRIPAKPIFWKRSSMRPTMLTNPFTIAGGWKRARAFAVATGISE